MMLFGQIDTYCLNLKIMTYNVWLSPESTHKKDRLELLKSLINKGDYDLFAMQEVWNEEVHKEMEEIIPIGFATSSSVGIKHRSFRKHAHNG